MFFFCTHSTSTSISFAAPKAARFKFFTSQKIKAHWKQNQPNISKGTRVCCLLTFVTTMMVNTSPFLKGRSCSEVPLKLYLATHSVPCGQGACREGRVTVSRWNFEKINLKSSKRNVNAHTDEQNDAFKYDFDCYIWHLDNTWLRREHFYVHYLNTITPNCLNVKYVLKCFLRFVALHKEMVRI